jgi:phosphoenolpyruvate carboxykinase (GTP)
VPSPESFDIKGMTGFTHDQFDKLQAINTEDWRREILQQDELFMKLYSHLPKELVFQRELLVSRIRADDLKIAF